MFVRVISITIVCRAVSCAVACLSVSFISWISVVSSVFVRRAVVRLVVSLCCVRSCFLIVSRLWWRSIVVRSVVRWVVFILVVSTSLVILFICRFVGFVIVLIRGVSLFVISFRVVT